MSSDAITRLENAIRATHGCRSQWTASVRVEERFEGKTAWDGIVEVFALVDHPKAKYAYAWTYPDDSQDKTIVVLKIPPVEPVMETARFRSSTMLGTSRKRSQTNARGRSCNYSPPITVTAPIKWPLI